MCSFKANKQKVPEQAFKKEVPQKRKIIIEILLCVKNYLPQSSLYLLFEVEVVRLLSYIG